MRYMRVLSSLITGLWFDNRERHGGRTKTDCDFVTSCQDERQFGLTHRMVFRRHPVERFLDHHFVKVPTPGLICR